MKKRAAQESPHCFHQNQTRNYQSQAWEWFHNLLWQCHVGACKPVDWNTFEYCFWLCVEQGCGGCSFGICWVMMWHHGVMERWASKELQNCTTQYSVWEMNKCPTYAHAKGLHCWRFSAGMPQVLGLSHEGAKPGIRTAQSNQEFAFPLLLLVTCVSNPILCTAHGSDSMCLYKMQLSAVRTGHEVGA